MPEESKDKDDRIIELLEEILKWTKFQGWQSVKSILSEVLDDDVSKLIYHYSDGSTIKEISGKLSIGRETVRRNWQKWAKVGIMKPVSAKGGTRYVKIFDLEDFGIDVPKMQEESSKTDSTSSEHEEELE